MCVCGSNFIFWPYNINLITSSFSSSSSFFGDWIKREFEMKRIKNDYTKKPVWKWSYFGEENDITLIWYNNAWQQPTTHTGGHSFIYSVIKGAAGRVSRGVWAVRQGKSDDKMQKPILPHSASYTLWITFGLCLIDLVFDVHACIHT